MLQSKRGRFVCLLVSGVIAVGVEAAKSEVSAPPTAARIVLAPVLRDRIPRHKPYDQPDLAAQFFVEQRLDPGMDRLDPARYAEAEAQAARLPQYSLREGRYLSDGDLRQAVGTWTSLGPGNVGGRTRAIRFRPGTPSTIYAGGVAGGVWRSTDSGSSWSALGDLLPNVAVTALAIDVSTPDRMFAGTGEGYFNLDAVYGGGIFASVDGGSNWTLLAATAPSSTGAGGDFRFVNDIEISPNDAQVLYAATGTGLWRSSDGGSNWTKQFDATNANGCMDIAIRSDVATNDTVVVSCGNFAPTDAANGLWRSANGNAATPTWTHVLGNTGSGATQSLGNMGRISLAVAPSAQATMYALIACSAVTGADCGNLAFDDGLLAVYRSTDGGASWSSRFTNTFTSTTASPVLSALILTNPNAYDCSNAVGYNQGWYDNTITVNPTNPDQVFAGGIDVFRSNDAGQNWGLVSYWWVPPSGQSYSDRYNHADQHTFVFHPNYDGSSETRFYTGNDGGLHVSSNAHSGTAATVICPGLVSELSTVSWSSLNNGYGVTQFYHGTVFPNGTTYLAGAQDNGTNVGTQAAPNAWTEVFGGDGGYTAVKPSNTSIYYVEYVDISISRTTDGGTNFTEITTPITDCGLFINPFALDPNSEIRLWTSGRALWRTDNAERQQGGGPSSGPQWTQTTISLPGTSCSPTTSAQRERYSAYAVAPNVATADLLVAGTSRGQLCRLTGASTASGATPTCSSPRGAGNGYVSWIAFDNDTDDAAAARTVYATFSNFTGDRVWRSDDGGQNWVALDDADGDGVGRLPAVPVHTLVADSAYGGGQRLYVGTDLGVFVTIDGGDTWARENAGFANVPVETLVLHDRQVGTRAPASGELFAFTHGRGAFQTSLKAAGGFCVSGLPVAIPDASAGGVTVTLDLTDIAPTSTIGDLDVRLGVTHGSPGQLSATLTRVGSGSATLFSGASCAAANVAALFDDDADYTAAFSCNNGLTGTLLGTFRPEQSLSVFHGGSYTSQWQLTVADTVAGTSGSLSEFCITASSSNDATVPATFSFLEATRVDPDRIDVAWQSAASASTLGYVVLATPDGESASVLVPAAADGTRLIDHGARAGVSGDRYYLGIIDIDGSREVRGPFTVGQRQGERRSPDSDAIDWAPSRAEMTSHRDLQVGAAEVDLAVTESGLQQVTFEAVVAAGGGGLAGVPVAELALFDRQLPVAIQVDDDNGAFDAGDRIVFFGEPLSRPGLTPNLRASLYGDAAHYRLRRASAAAIRMRETYSSAEVAAAGGIAQGRTLVEENHQYTFASSSRDPWAWARVVSTGAPAATEVAFELPTLGAGQGAKLAVTLMGGITLESVWPDHHAVFRVNGSTVADVRFDGLATERVVVDLPAGVLVKGANTLAIELPGDNGYLADVVYLEDVLVEHVHERNSVDGRLDLVLTGVSGVGPVPVVAGELFADQFETATDPCGASATACNTLELTGLSEDAVVLVFHAGLPYRVRRLVTTATGVRMTLPLAEGTRVVAAANGALAQPAVMGVADPEAILSVGPVDYLVIASAAMEDGVAPLIAARQAQGLRTRVVTTPAIFERFNAGMPSGEAIAAFIADAHARWGVRYVLLAGGDSYDYRNDLGLGSVSHVPTVYRVTDEIVRFAASDAALADVNGDGVPDVAIGRLPARTGPELAAMVAKSLALEANASGRAIFVADSQDGRLDFAALSDAQSVALGAYSPLRVFRDDYPNDDAAMHAQLVQSINAGARLVHYFGHSAPNQWTFGSVMTTTQVSSGELINIDLPLVAQWGCWSGHFVDPRASSISHAFLIADHGAGAVVGASTLTNASSDHVFARMFYEELVVPGATLGDALLRAKQRLRVAYPDARDVQHGTHLFGDPAARFGQAP